MSNFTNNFKHIPIVTSVLIAISIILYIALPIIPGGETYYDMGVLTPLSFMQGQWWTLFTSMFLHSGLMHIACNMISLYYLGVMCERIFGPVKYLVLYILSGLAGGIVYVIVNMAAGDVLAGAVGASGAIFGLFGAYGYLLLREHKDNKILVYRPGASDIQSYLGILAINLVIGFTPGSHIANEAHIGGMICGFIVGAILYAITTRNIPSIQSRHAHQHESYRSDEFWR